MPPVLTQLVALCVTATVDLKEMDSVVQVRQSLKILVCIINFMVLHYVFSLAVFNMMGCILFLFRYQRV